MHQAIVQHLVDLFYRRNLPWRGEECPVDLQVMVEGLLARTRAESVANGWERIFDGVSRADDWIELSHAEKLSRTEFLGLPTRKVRSVDDLASRIVESRRTGGTDMLDYFTRTTTYTSAVVALRYGRVGYPVDANVRRIAKRMKMRAVRLSTDVVVSSWSRTVSGSEGGIPIVRPTAYKAFCGLLDVGRFHCTPRLLMCSGCLLSSVCPSRS